MSDTEIDTIAIALDAKKLEDLADAMDINVGLAQEIFDLIEAQEFTEALAQLEKLEQGIQEIKTVFTKYA